MQNGPTLMKPQEVRANCIIVQTGPDDWIA